MRTQASPGRVGWIFGSFAERDEALALLESGQEFDLMITDYSMPGMNGAELGKAARRLRPEMPILVASGYAELPAGAGVDLPRLGKPYSQTQLANEIGKLLKKPG